ncbi:MAG TPA: amino acid permease, partial [Patescibacteria group bacterium]|nr:amino acid permease [Patescibacteria group bacterium]
DGLITWFSLSLKSAFALVGMAAFTTYLIAVDIRLIAVLLCAVFVMVNLAGIKEASRVQVALVICLLALLLLYVVRGLPAVTIGHFEPFAPSGMGGIFRTTGFVFISFGGLLKVASVAEEVKNPARVIPLGMILSLFIVTVLYFLVVLVTTGVLGPAQFEGSLTPLSEGAAVFMGSFGRIALSVAAVLAFISTANAGIMAASRYPLALSRDGLLPSFLGAVHPRYKTPHRSIVITGLLMIAAVFLRLDVLVKVASTVLVLTFMFSCFSIIILRESRLQNYQPVFRAPLYPWLQIIGLAGFSALLVIMGKEALWVSLLVIVGGLFVYWFYGRIRSEREFALLHLIERITAKELTTHSLESELKEIIRERDEIVKDRFDRIVENGAVLDLVEPMAAGEFFSLVARTMSGNLGIEPGVLYDLLVEREKESSTVLTPSLAIPHIVIDGAQTFDILLVRAREGISFSDAARHVHAIFVLVGTRDERNFHLRALAAIAQIVQDPHFERRWMAAKDTEALRDVILLGRRMR